MPARRIWDLPNTISTIGAAADASGAAPAASGVRPRPFNLRGWMLYRLARWIAPDYSDPAVLRALIAEDRARGPARPPEKLLRKLAFRESRDDGLLAFHASAKGAPPSALKLLYLHGGAYVLDLQEIQWQLVAGLLDRVDAEVIAPIYPLGPEASWHETTTAAQDFYLALAQKHGADNIVIVGDSAGGGLALLIAQAVRDRNLPRPRALVLISPAFDLSGSGADQPELETRDPVLSLRMLRDVHSLWAKDVAADDPRISPLFASQDDLPPTIVFSGDRDILHSDALRLKAINPAIEHRSYPEMMHVFPLSPLRETRRALDEAAAFIHQHTA